MHFNNWKTKGELENILEEDRKNAGCFSHFKP